MPRYTHLMAVTAMLALMSAAHAVVMPADTCVANVTASLDALTRGDHAAAVRNFDAKLLRQHDAANLNQMWSQLLHLLGAYQSHAAPQWQAFGSRRYLITQITFATKSFDAINACDAAGKLSYAEFGPVSDAGAKIANAKPRVLDGGVREQPLAVASPFGPLPGTLVLPAGHGPFPAVLLIVGSGPQDGDETIGPNKPFRDLAEGLAAAGIASLRYDKRTYSYRLKSALDASLTVDDEVTDDALTALTLLAKQPGIDAHRVFVLGHSLGAMLAPRIAQHAPQLAGVILLAAPARTLLDVSAQQVREQGQRTGASAAQIAASEHAIADERKLLAKADPRHPPEGMFGGVPQSYWLSLFDYDQVRVAEHLAMPMLFLQGAADFQVSPSADFARWQQALADRKNVVFHLYPGLSHLFMPAGTSGTIKDYDAPAHVDAQLVRDTADWVQAQPPARAVVTNHGD